jgi:hypothetical protein
MPLNDIPNCSSAPLFQPFTERLPRWLVRLASGEEEKVKHEP